MTAGTSQGASPAWNGTLSGLTIDGSVSWQNIGLGANWLIPFGVDTEPAPTPSAPSRYNIIVADEGYSMLFRLATNGEFIVAPLATGTSYVTSIDVITSVPTGGVDPPPVRSNGQPTGVLPAGTTQTNLSLSTNENATCRYSLQAGRDLRLDDEYILDHRRHDPQPDADRADDRHPSLLRALRRPGQQCEHG